MNLLLPSIPCNSVASLKNIYQTMKLDNLTLLSAASNVPGCTYGDSFIYLFPDFQK